MTKLMLGRHLFVWPWSAVPPGLPGLAGMGRTRVASPGFEPKSKT